MCFFLLLLRDGLKWGSLDVGLQNDGQPMTMIPTYVTSVPNGTEKVKQPIGKQKHELFSNSTTRECIWLST